MAGEAALTLAEEEQRAKQRRCQRTETRGGGSRDLVGNCENLRDFTINRIFPLIQSSNDEMVKIEVVELFKSYNFALGLKFRNCYRHNLTGPKDGPRATWAKGNHRNGLRIGLYANVSGARMAMYLRVV
jgi:hypothetical protein